jgi:hypothetical protein
MDEESNLQVTNVEFMLNHKVILGGLVIIGLSMLLSGCLVYLFSGSLLTVMCSLVIGITLGVLANYFLLSNAKLVKGMTIKTLPAEAEEDFTSTMKIE